MLAPIKITMKALIWNEQFLVHTIGKDDQEVWQKFWTMEPLTWANRTVNDKYAIVDIDIISGPFEYAQAKPDKLPDGMHTEPAQQMHEAGRTLIAQGYSFYKEVINHTPECDALRAKYGAGPRNLFPAIIGDDVHVVIMDGDLPGYGVYLFAKTQQALEAL